METEVLPHPNEKPAGCHLQLWVTVAGYHIPILAVCNGGSEVALMSQRLYEQLDPKPELCPTTEKIKGLYDPNHSPMGEFSIRVKIPELSVVINYDFIVEDIEEDLLLNVQCFIMHSFS